MTGSEAGASALRQRERLPRKERQADALSLPGLQAVLQSEDEHADAGLEALRKRAWAIYLEIRRLKGVSSMKLHRDLGVRQAAAWYMVHRIREAFIDVAHVFESPVEVDETYMGGKERSKRASKKQRAGRGPVKAPVAVMKDRKTKRVTVKVLDDTTKASILDFVETQRAEGATLYTDEARAYKGLKDHEATKHSVGEYVRGMAHTNRVESSSTT